MLKNSFIIVFIQSTGLILAFVSVYIVAGDMGPEIYSLKGIQTIVAGIMLTFSHLGIETTMMRETLFWMENGDHEKVKEYATQSIISRLLGFIILTPFVFGYLVYLSFSKYEGAHLWLFFFYYVGSCVSALNNSMSLIIRSQGGYVFAQLVSTINSEVIGAVAILIYVLWGASPYLYFFALSPIPVLFVFYFRLGNLFSCKHVNIRDTFHKIRESRYLWLRSYNDYIKTSADSLLVSILFPSSVIGVYSIYKTLENMFKAFIEGFFDVLSQATVRYKGKVDKLLREERKFNYIRYSAIILFIFSGLIFSINSDFFVDLVNLTKYPNMDLIIYTVLIVSIVYLIGKYEINMVSLFASSKTTFYVGCAITIVTIFSYIIIWAVPSIIGALMQRIVSWGGASLISIWLFRKNRWQYYSVINK